VDLRHTITRQFLYCREDSPHTAGSGFTDVLVTRRHKITALRVIQVATEGRTLLGDNLREGECGRREPAGKEFLNLLPGTECQNEWGFERHLYEAGEVFGVTDKKGQTYEIRIARSPVAGTLRSPR
jgi:hypothetical protein